MRQPDIEIYLREDHVKDLLAWIPEALGPLVLEEAKGNTRQGVIQSTPAIPLMIVRKAAGKWTSIWFDSAETPWASDTECAHAVHTALGHEVRCSIGSWNESEGVIDPDRWLKVNADGESEFVWAL
ncbi:MAG: hypothetical protein WA929_10335 [Pseudomonas neustonica]